MLAIRPLSGGTVPRRHRAGATELRVRGASLPSFPRARRLAQSARAAAKGGAEPEYVFGDNERGRKMAVPTNPVDKFWYNFYFAKPQQSDWERQLQEFADSKFKGLRTWKVAFTELRAARTKSLEPAAVRALIAARPGPLALFSPAAVLLDVREPAVFEGGHAVGAVNVPLYTSMEAPKDNFDKLRSAYFALFGLRVPVRNEDFAAQVLKRVGRKDVPLILQCQTGGTLETARERKIRAPRMPAPVYKEFGAASRSLMAAHELLKAGFTRVSHAEGGLSRWKADGLGVEAE